MKKNLLFALMLSLGSAAQAEIRLNWYDSARSSCQSLQHALENEGRMVLLTGPDLYTTVVRDISFCMPQEYLKDVVLKTRDNKKCLVGYNCQTR